ncbi:TraB/GumN family protein [Sphingomonas sp. LHG3406-1]|uniref:TraB/GumN family protein n=1 Tax=Sphingomonas sp. LHG3406-1 TaxID=2804617 RepID=UPI002611F9C6|nr:TraB/GumN family protein [Sphingomonas sp. LHG3406-1]
MAVGWFRKGLAALGLIAAGGMAAEAKVPAAPRPALWKVADRDTTVYLFGTIHLLPRGFSWRSAVLDRAAREAQGLVVETIVDPANPAPLAEAMMRLGVSPGLQPVMQRVPAAKRPALASAIAKSGAQPAALDRLETWAVALALLGPQFSAMGLQQDEGVEMALKRDFTAAGKPIGQLETNAEQLGFFDVLPESAQRKLLEGAIERPEEVRGQFDSMLAAWARGDVRAIARTFNADMSGSPEMGELLLKRRNENWTRWIEGRLQQPGSVLVAVGAGHLAGPDSVQAMLEKRGFKVTRVQ